MNLRQMEVFYAIMRSGSITAAAAYLNISQPAVSTTLKHCETQLRMNLFFREGGRLTPTPEAQTIYPTIRAIFDRVEAVDRMTRELAAGRTGTLTLASSPPLTGMLSYAISSFVENRADCRVSALTMSAREMIDRVSRNELDLGLTYSLVQTEGVQSEPLFDTELVCIMHKDHHLSAMSSVTFADISSEPVITYVRDGLLRSRIDEAAVERDVTLDVRYGISSAMTGVMLAGLKVGVAIVEPTFLSQFRLSSVVARPFEPALPLTIYMVGQRTHRLSQLTQSFARHIRSIAASNQLSAGIDDLLVREE